MAISTLRDADRNSRIFVILWMAPLKWNIKILYDVFNTYLIIPYISKTSFKLNP